MNSIDKKICYLAESLLVKGEFMSWRRFNLPAFSIPDFKISSICNQQSDRIVVEKIITTGIVDSRLGKDASTTYLVEVLAAVSIVSYLEGNDLAIVASDSLNSYEQPFTFTICHHSDDSFILLDVAF
ncbi:hypothetical protein [Chamaesiphon minutus]|uniref:Uncharacterized protein n=1 Tax=Chamaesiphon minutus (strain ATCC 27169 / PCC 6605) TaxID=1173020 RepID=K9UG15_CHAP6|nr:hypothetical protein [Chamaesiphon minutus]AFY93154.1 hypothetical protein Cha6605_2059 [Chamaesiphon minutus PCC 6605]